MTKVEIKTAALAAADRGPLLAAMAAYAHRPVEEWLPAGHPAGRGDLPRTWKGMAAVSDSQRVEALAVAAPNHCLDGWGYAARALSSFLAGDLHATRHLSYYAQLRAGLSILGGLGVGIFNAVNFVVKSDGSTERLDTGPQDKRGMGTHHAVWGVLEEVAKSLPLSSRFLALLPVSGSSVEVALHAIWPGATSAPLASHLIQAWGMDLARGADEHANRNRSSYNPQSLQSLPDHPADRAHLVDKIWRVFEPVSATRFDMLDRHLLRAVLWKQHDIVAPGSGRAAGAIGRRYDELPTDIQRIASKAFLVGDSERAELKLLKLARIKRSEAHADEMLCRALLLLRAATAVTTSNFSSAGVVSGTGALRPWIDPLAALRGFWPPTAPLADAADLWADVELALHELAASMNPRPVSLNAWYANRPVGTPTIVEMERVAVWSLGL